MAVIPNNCVSHIKIPDEVNQAYAIDYSPALGLYASLSDDTVYVWDPKSGKILAESYIHCEGSVDMMFVPGDRIAYSEGEAHHGGCVTILTFQESGEFDEYIIGDEFIRVSYPAGLALTPDKNILVIGMMSNAEEICEIVMDWENLKALRSRMLWNSDEHPEDEMEIPFICCTSKFEVFTSQYDSVTRRRVCNNYPPLCDSESESNNEEEEEGNKSKCKTEDNVVIKNFILNGKDDDMIQIDGLAHDGTNLIIATGNNIMLLASAVDGTEAHLIASDIKPSGQVRVNHKGQLMVCGYNTIKVFEYRSNPVMSLQDLCRDTIREVMQSNFKGKVKRLPIPSSIKEYLLYR